jgi:hypothetical protein
MFKNLLKNMKAHYVISFIAVVILGYAVMQYSNQKGNMADGFSGYAYESGTQGGNGQQKPQQQQMDGNSGGARPAEPAGQNEVYASVTGINTTSTGLTPTMKAAVANPSDLLPKDSNSAWAEFNPAGKGDLKNVSLLKAGYHIGIDTIGSSLRNANLQERSEPPNPTTAVSPWMNTTIEPDLMRAPLEIGCGGQ